MGGSIGVAQERTMQDPQKLLDAIAAEIRDHATCGFDVCTQATRLVPGEGSATADVVIVGEAPGADEDRESLPFVGRAGRLLDELLAEPGLNREASATSTAASCNATGARCSRCTTRPPRCTTSACSRR
jgi:uracil-DNA glycosylase family 4